MANPNPVAGNEPTEGCTEVQNSQGNPTSDPCGSLLGFSRPCGWDDYNAWKLRADDLAPLIEQAYDRAIQNFQGWPGLATFALQRAKWLGRQVAFPNCYGYEGDCNIPWTGFVRGEVDKIVDHVRAGACMLDEYNAAAMEYDESLAIELPGHMKGVSSSSVPWGWIAAGVGLGLGTIAIVIAVSRK